MRTKSVQPLRPRLSVHSNSLPPSFDGPPTKQIHPGRSRSNNSPPSRHSFVAEAGSTSPVLISPKRNNWSQAKSVKKETGKKESGEKVAPRNSVPQRPVGMEVDIKPRVATEVDIKPRVAGSKANKPKRPKITKALRQARLEELDLWENDPQIRTLRMMMLICCWTAIAVFIAIPTGFSVAYAFTFPDQTAMLW